MIGWDAEAKRAQDGIREVGAVTAISRGSGTGYNEETDSYEAADGFNGSCHAVLSTQTITDDSGRMVQAVIATCTAEIKSGDTLTIAGQEYRVSKALTIAPGGVPLLWSAVLET